MKKLSLIIESTTNRRSRMIVEADEPTNLETAVSDPSPMGGNMEDNPQPQQKPTYLNKKDIKFTIWETVDKKIQHLKDNNSYQRIEYKYIDNTDKIVISFLLGYSKTEKSWCMWVGKIGAVSYNDDPYYVFGTQIFNEAVLLSLNKIVRYVQTVKDDKDNWLQYYSE